MSQPRTGYQRSFPGMIGAMLVVVLVIVGWVGFRELTSDKEPTAVKTVEWKPWIRAAEQDGFPVLAPTELPEGWRATSARYTSGSAPALHVGLLTDDGKYVGLEESTGTLRDLVEQYVDPEAEEGEAVEIDGETWQTWTDAGGDYAVGRFENPGTEARTAYLVVGSAPEADIRGFAGLLVADVGAVGG